MSRKGKNRAIILMLSLLNIGFSVSVLAEVKSFTIGVQKITDYKPYSEFKNNSYQGFNRELLELFANYAGYRFTYQALPIKRLGRYLEEQRVGFRYPDNAYWYAAANQGQKIIYSDPVVKFVDGVLVRPEQKGRGLNELKNLGVVLGYTPKPYEKYIASGQLSIFQNSNLKRLINQVKRGHTSGLYINVAVGQNQLQTVIGEPSALVFDPELPHIVGTRHLSTIKYPQVIALFNRFLGDKAEQIKQLKLHYGVENLPEH